MAILGCLLAVGFLVAILFGVRSAWQTEAPREPDEVLRERGFRNSYFGWVISLVDGSRSPAKRVEGEHERKR